ncbi:hypothetical protein ANN_10723 [Periplaneta americana]|uniref:Uncharacterized protein n=1 Tax=Periplaneta americana TaxID=6978 RepID=A0ABQ8T319_PERAM|nr:hypothetical protein ANN_10723 [Periplaneta americana]
MRLRAVYSNFHNHCGGALQQWGSQVRQQANLIFGLPFVPVGDRPIEDTLDFIAERCDDNLQTLIDYVDRVYVHEKGEELGLQAKKRKASPEQNMHQEPGANRVHCEKIPGLQEQKRGACLFKDNDVQTEDQPHFGTQTELIFVNGGALIAHRYKVKKSANHVISFAAFAGENFILMHDNSHLNAARCIGDYLRDIEIPTLD